MSRAARSFINGRSSWRTRLRRKRGSAFDGSWANRSPSDSHSATVSDRRSARIGSRRARRHRAEPARSRAAEQREQQRLGLIVGGVAGHRVGAEHQLASDAGPGFEVRSVEPGRRARRRNPMPRRSAVSRAHASSSSPTGRSPWLTWTAVTSQSAATASRTSAVESAPPDSPQTHGVPAGGNVDRRSRSAIMSSVEHGSIRGRPTGGDASSRPGSYFFDVTVLEVHRDERDQPTKDEQGDDDADPPVPDFGCEHGVRLTAELRRAPTPGRFGPDVRQIWPAIPAGEVRSADDAVAVEVGVEAPFDPRRAGRRGISSLLALRGDDLLQLGVEVERLQAVDAAVEVVVDRCARRRRTARRRGTDRVP